MASVFTRALGNATFKNINLSFQLKKHNCLKIFIIIISHNMCPLGNLKTI